jgi:hypothetical protein
MTALPIMLIAAAAIVAIVAVRNLRLVRRERDHAMSMLRDALAAKAREWESAQRQMAGLMLESARADRVADAARRLATGKNEPGEWKALRDALAEYDGGANG